MLFLVNCLQFPAFNKCFQLAATQRGYILSKPTQLRFDVVRVAVVVLTCAWMGSTIGQRVARHLKENYIYIHNDDDK